MPNTNDSDAKKMAKIKIVLDSIGANTKRPTRRTHQGFNQEFYSIFYDEQAETQAAKMAADKVFGSSVDHIGIDSPLNLKENEGSEQQDLADDQVSSSCVVIEPKKKTRKVIGKMSDETNKLDQGDILASLIVEPVQGRTHLVAIVVDNGDPAKHDAHKNTRQSVRCNHGTAFSEGYPYDQGSDSYMVACVYQVPLGLILIAYRLSMPTVGEWHIRVPLPEAVVNRYMNGGQKSKIAELQVKYPRPRFNIQIMQVPSSRFT